MKLQKIMTICKVPWTLPLSAIGHQTESPAQTNTTAKITDSVYDFRGEQICIVDSDTEM